MSGYVPELKVTVYFIFIRPYLKKRSLTTTEPINFFYDIGYFLLRKENFFPNLTREIIDDRIPIT